MAQGLTLHEAVAKHLLECAEAIAVRSSGVSFLIESRFGLLLQCLEEAKDSPPPSVIAHKIAFECALVPEMVRGIYNLTSRTEAVLDRFKNQPEDRPYSLDNADG